MIVEGNAGKAICAVVAIIDEIVDNDGKDNDIDPHGY